MWESNVSTKRIERLKVPFIYFAVMKARFVSKENIRAPPFLATDNSLGVFLLLFSRNKWML